MKEAGVEVGRGIIEFVIDTARRPWTGGMPTPPWAGIYACTAHAHFVHDRQTGARLGSFVVIHPRRVG